MIRSLLHMNEAPGAHAPSWYAASARPRADAPPLDGDIRVDAAVIGAGFSGLSTALHLAERGLDVVVIDAHRVGWGASGRNGGQVGWGLRIEVDDIAALAGAEVAEAAHRVGMDAARLVRDLIGRHGIACALKPGVLEANHRARFDAPARAHAGEMRARYGADIRYVPPSEMPEMLGARGYSGGILNREAAHLHPLNYARGLADAAERAGARIFEMTEAEAVRPGAPARVETRSGVITADQVVIAANGYLGGLDAGVARRVMPIANYVIATEPLGEARARALIRDDVAVADSRFVVNYFRLSEDRRMIFGGGESYGYRFPRDIAAVVRPRMIGLFPDLADARIDHAWGGALAITRTRLPDFARVAPGVRSIGGYSGSGVALATMAGRIAAEDIAGDGARFDLMAGLPTPGFPGGAALRHPLLILAMAWFTLRDRLL